MRRLASLVLLVTVFLSAQIPLLSQGKYVWSGGLSGAWTDAAKWTPPRTTPLVTDTLWFNGGSVTVSDVPTATIGKLRIFGSSTVNLNTSTTAELTVSSATGGDINVESGSMLQVVGGVTLTSNDSLTNFGTIASSGTLKIKGKANAPGDHWINVVFAAPTSFNRLYSDMAVLGNVTVAAGASLVAWGGARSLTVSGTLTNNHEIYDWTNTLTISVNGSFVNNGTMESALTLTGTGNLSGTTVVDAIVTIDSTATVTVTSNLQLSATLTVNGELIIGASKTLTADYTVVVNGKISGENATSSVLLFDGGYAEEYLTFPISNPGATISKARVRIKDSYQVLKFSGVCNLESGASFEIDNSATFKIVGSADGVIKAGVGNGSIYVKSGELDLAGKILTLEGVSSNSLTLNVQTYGVVKNSLGGSPSITTKGNVLISQGGDFSVPLRVYSGTTSAWNEEVEEFKLLPGPDPGIPPPVLKKSPATARATPTLATFDGDLSIESAGTLTIPLNETLEITKNVTLYGPVSEDVDGFGKSKRDGLLRRAVDGYGTINGQGSLIFGGNNKTFTNWGIVDAATTFQDDAGDVKTISGDGSWKSLTIAVDCSTTVGGTHTFTGPGTPFVVNGSVTLAIGSEIEYQGSSAQTIAAMTYSKLEIMNAAGANLPSPVSVNQSLEMTQGNLTTGAHTLTLGQYATVDESGGSVLGSFYSVRTCTTETIQSFGGIGMEITAFGFTSFPSKFQTSQGRASLPPNFDIAETRFTGTAPLMSGITFVKRYFLLQASGDGMNATLVFHYRTDELNGATEANLQLYESTDNGITWIARGGTLDTAANEITITGVNTLNRWTAGHPSGTPPTLSVVSPVSGGAGETVLVTLTGTNFTSGTTTVSFSGAGITVNSVAYLSSTQVRPSITIAAGAALGMRNVTVTTPGGTATKTNGFEVVRPAPLLTNISPTAGGRGQSLSVFLNGIGFVNGVTTAVFGEGITVASVDGNSASLTAQIDIAQSAVLGPRSVTVSTPAPGGGESTLNEAFNVVNPTPTITSIAPTSGTRGKTLNVVVTGANYYSGATSLSLGNGMSVDSVVVLSNTQLQARLSIAFEASSGARDVFVTNASPGGGSAALAGGFTVNNPVPKITAVSPAVASRGKSTTVTITGTDFVIGSTGVSAGAGISAGSVTVVSSTQLTASLTISRIAALGARDLTVTNGTPGGGTGTLTGGLTVQNPAPATSSVSPQSGILGQTLSVVVTGSDFYNGVTTADFGAGVTVNSTSVDTAGIQLSVSLTISPTTEVGNRSITLTNSAPGGGSSTLVNGFVVNNPAPTLTRISPVSGGKGQTLDVAIVGTNFISGVTSVEFGLGITVGTVTVNSPTSMTATITVDGSTVTGARGVSVINAPPGGGKATLAAVFNVENLVPTITGVTPATGSRGEAVTVNVTGTGFSTGSTTVTFGSGITISSITVTSPTQISANLAIASGAGLGARNIVVTNPPPGGGIATMTNGFTVGNPAPTVTAVAPAAASRGQSLAVTVTGTGFFSGATTVSLGPSIDVTSTNVVSPTQLTATIAVASGAATGSRSVQVINPAPGGGTGSLASGFTVTNPAPTIVGIAPNSVVRGGTVSVTITGTQFIDGVTSLGLGSDLTVTSFSVRSSTDIQATISAASTANAGVRDVSVTNSAPGGGTATLSGGFTVSNPLPTIVSISPTSAGRGSFVNVTITGTQFISGVTTVSFGPDASVTSPNVKSASELQVSVSIGVTAATGVRAVSVTNSSPGGGTATLASGFNVTTSPATGIEGELGVIPDEYVLQEAYPNPFNPSTRVRYGIPENSRVELVVHNMLGNVVAHLISGERSKGLYELLWHAENLPSGVYLIRLHAESVESTKRFIASRKVVLVK